MSENPLVYHKQFILKGGAPRHMPFSLKEARKDIETYRGVLVIWVIEMN